KSVFLASALQRLQALRTRPRVYRSKRDEARRKAAYRIGNRPITFGGRVGGVLAGRTEDGLRDVVAVHCGHKRVEVHAVFAVTEKRRAVVAMEVDDHPSLCYYSISA